MIEVTVIEKEEPKLTFPFMFMYKDQLFQTIKVTEWQSQKFFEGFKEHYRVVNVKSGSVSINLKTDTFEKLIFVIKDTFKEWKPVDVEIIVK